MHFTYKKLWKLLIDRNMKKSDLMDLAGISKSTMAKLSKGQNVNTDVLLKICVALDCDITEIIELENSENLG